MSLNVALNNKQRSHLKSLAHPLKVVVQTGSAGLSPAVIKEADTALTAHELIKVRLVAEDRDDRQAMIEQLCEATRSQFVQQVGHIATIYRQHPEKPKISLPKA